jgi:peptidoglycan DL-endopeptidase LytE
MFTKKLISLLSILIVMAVALVPVSGARAGSGACGGNVTVVAGDTLRKIADHCYTSVAALQLANGIRNPNLIYTGQVLVMPGALLKGNGTTDIYIVKRSDTLKSLASDFTTTMEVLLWLNPNITNPNLIYEGQRLNVPAPGSIPPTPPPTSGQIYTVQRGDTMRKIAARLGTSLEALAAVNPQVGNINLIYVGQKLNIPAGLPIYIVVRGDTLAKIAVRFGTTLEALLSLNPGIWNPNVIYVGQVIKLR